MWALVVFALCGNPGHRFECPARIEVHHTLAACQSSLQAFGSRVIDGKTWHALHPHGAWCGLATKPTGSEPIL
jgi:hypothetical protein